MKRKFPSLRSVSVDPKDNEHSGKESIPPKVLPLIADSRIPSIPQQELVSDSFTNTSAGNSSNLIPKLLDLLKKLQDGIPRNPPLSCGNPIPDFLPISEPNSFESPLFFKHWRRKYYQRRHNNFPSSVLYTIKYSALKSGELKILHQLSINETPGFLYDFISKPCTSYLPGDSSKQKEGSVSEGFTHIGESSFRNFTSSEYNTTGGGGDHFYISVETSAEENLERENAQNFADDVFIEQPNSQEMNTEDAVTIEEMPHHDETASDLNVSHEDTLLNRVEIHNVSVEDYTSTPPAQEIQDNTQENPDLNLQASIQLLTEEIQALKIQLNDQKLSYNRTNQPSSSSSIPISSMNSLDFMLIAARLGLFIPEAFEDPLMKILAGDRIEELKDLLKNALQSQQKTS